MTLTLKKMRVRGLFGPTVHWYEVELEDAGVCYQGWWCSSESYYHAWPPIWYPVGWQHRGV